MTLRDNLEELIYHHRSTLCNGNDFSDCDEITQAEVHRKALTLLLEHVANGILEKDISSLDYYDFAALDEIVSKVDRPPQDNGLLQVLESPEGSISIFGSNGHSREIANYMREIITGLKKEGGYNG